MLDPVWISLISTVIAEDGAESSQTAYMAALFPVGFVTRYAARCATWLAAVFDFVQADVDTETVIAVPALPTGASFVAKDAKDEDTNIRNSPPARGMIFVFIGTPLIIVLQP